MSDQYGCQGCCTFPNGRWAVMGMIFAIVSWGLNGGASGGCRYVKAEGLLDLGLNLGGSTSTGLGLYLVEDIDGQCVVWSDAANDTIIDATWNAARAMGSLSSFCALVTMISMICASCMGLRVCFLRILGGLAAAASFFVILTMLVFASDVCDESGLLGVNCVFNVGAGLAIGAFIAWLITAFVLCKVPPPVQRENDYPPPASAAAAAPTATAMSGTAAPPAGTVTVTETVLPDGTKKITRTTYNADGSKTVEETIESLNTAIPTASAKTY